MLKQQQPKETLFHSAPAVARTAGMIQRLRQLKHGGELDTDGVSLKQQARNEQLITHKKMAKANVDLPSVYGRCCFIKGGIPTV